MRHPELHQTPEVLAFEASTVERARIELGQHTDGRWMWATSMQGGNAGHGYACGAKWKRFAPSRGDALDNACAELAAKGYVTPRVRDWLATLQTPQGDLFG